MKPMVIAQHLLRHAALGAVVYMAFRFFPQNRMSSNNVLILTCLVVMVHISFEYLCGMYQTNNKSVDNGSKSEDEQKIESLLESFNEMTSDNSNCPCASGKIEGFADTDDGPENVERSAQAIALDRLVAERERGYAPRMTEAADPEPVSEPTPSPTVAAAAPSSDGKEEQIDNLKERIQELEKIVRENSQKPTALQQKMDPFNDAGETYPVREDVTRGEQGVSLSDMGYHDHNHLPVADNYKSDEDDFGWSYLPPEKWFPEPPNPPVCVTQKRCPVCPSYTVGAPVDVKEWHSSTRITAPDNINTQYVKDKLNAGR